MDQHCGPLSVCLKKKEGGKVQERKKKGEKELGPSVEWSFRSDFTTQEALLC